LYKASKTLTLHINYDIIKKVETGRKGDLMPRRMNPTRDEGRNSGLVGERLLADIRGEVWRKYAGRFEDLAGEARLHQTTVENFAFGDTTSPRWETIVRLLVALDRYDLLARALRIDTPMTREEARKKR
jgi:hypothetical protein